MPDAIERACRSSARWRNGGLAFDETQSARARQRRYPCLHHALPRQLGHGRRPESP